MSHIKRVLLGATMLSMTAPTMPALAQSDLVMERIVVTTQKREESVLDVPIALTAISGEFLENTLITDLDDLSDYVAGFQLQLQSIDTPSFVIRGITSDVSEPDAEPNISVFYDGIPASRGGGSVIELFDLERVEIAKGPQGTLFSRGASNGAINFIMKKPQDEFEAFGRIMFGNFNSERYEGVVNAPIIEDGGLAVRLGAVFEQRDGFVENEAAEDQNFSGKDTLHLRAGITARPFDLFEYTLLAFWQYDSPDPGNFKTLVPQLAAADPFLRSTDPFGEYAQNPGIFTEREVYGFTGLGEYELNDAITLSSTTGFREFQNTNLFDPDGTSIQIIDATEDDDARTIFHEFRVSYDDGGRFRGFGGASYYREEATRNRIFGINQTNTLGSVLPLLAGGVGLPPLPPLPVVDEKVTTESETTSYSVFLDGTFDITSRLSLTLGARWTTDDKELSFTSPVTQSDFGFGVQVPGSLLPLALSDFQELFAFGAGDLAALGRFVDSLPTNPFGPGNPILLQTLADGFGIDLINPASPLFGLLSPEQIARLSIIETNALEGTTGGVTLTNSDTFSYFEPRAIIEFRPVDNWMVYASYSWGIRSGGVEIEPRAGLTRGDFGRTVNEERVTSYEIGAKGAFDWDGLYLQLEAAGFYYDYEDFQTLIVQGGSLQNVNAGQADALGFEVAANASFEFGLDGFMNVGFIDGGFEEGSTAAVLGPAIDLSGNDFRLTPRWTVSGGVSYTRPLTEELDGFISVLASYRSSFFFNPENETATPIVPVDLAQDGYTTVTLNAGLNFRDRWELRGRVENLFDEEFLVDAGNTGRVIGIPTAIRGQPRLWTVGISTRF